MENIILVCGRWVFEKNRWMFHVDNERGSKLLTADESTYFDDFVAMVYEDYELDKQVCDIELSYMIPKKKLQKSLLDTPPVKVRNFRQFSVFMGLFKSDRVRLCVEVKEKNECEVNEGSIGLHDVNGNDQSKYEDDYSRFDYCDDSDGKTSEDEDFRPYGLVEDDADKKTPTLDLETLKIVVGQCFDKEALVTRLKILAVIHHFDFDVDRSTPRLFVAKCWITGCVWKVRASTIGDSPHLTIRIYVSEHTCSVTERSARSRQATPDILGLLYKNYIGGFDLKVLPSHVALAMKNTFNVKMDYWKAHRTLKYARELVAGSPESGYNKLPAYLHMIRRANPGTRTRLEVDDCNRFKYLFIAFGASIDGFPFMRKVVVVDGTFLQGKYKGTLLVATTQDGNFQIFPIAFAVVDTENDESWEWFFKQLSCVIPDDDGLAIISDRHRSIGKAIGKVYRKANRGICTYHLYKNILLRCKGRGVFGLVKKAANAYKISDFETFFDAIGALNPSLHNYLQQADVRLWTRAHFPGDRYNITTTNIAESINKVLHDARSLPVVHLLDAIRLMLTRWFASRRNDAELMKTTLTRGVEKLLGARIPYAKKLTVQAIDLHQVQVTSVSSLYVVNLTEKRCSCRRFDLEKIPCVHAIAAAEAKQVSVISLCHPYYHKNFLCDAYSSAIMPKNEDLPIPEHVSKRVCFPPLVRQPPGRPKKSRIKSTLERTASNKRPRKKHRCSLCKQVGHNRSTCSLS